MSNFCIICLKDSVDVLILQCHFQKVPLKLNNVIWAAFVRKFVAKTFQSKSNLVTLPSTYVSLYAFMLSGEGYICLFTFVSDLIRSGLALQVHDRHRVHLVRVLNMHLQ